MLHRRFAIRNDARILGTTIAKEMTLKSTYYSEERDCPYASVAGAGWLTKMWSGEGWTASA